MSFYKTASEIWLKYFGKDTLFKYGFNYSPMYRRSTGKVIAASKDLLNATIKIPLSYKNRNYANSIFGGSMFSAVDPIPMIQLVYILGDDYVIWDKSAEIKFRRPAKEDAYAQFNFTKEELEEIKKRVKAEKEIDIVKTTQLKNKDGSIVFCEVSKTIYIADKAFYKEKRKLRKEAKNAQTKTSNHE